MTAASDLLVTNVTIAAPSTGWRPFAGWLACSDGRVAALGQKGEDGPQAIEVIDGEGGLLLPGLRNAHTHSSEILARGMADGLDLAAWLAVVWPQLDRLTAEQIGVAVRCCALLSIRCGITTMVDHLRRTPMTDEIIAAAAEAYRQIGMRALIAVMVRDRLGAGGAIGASHLHALETAHRQLDRIAAAAQNLACDRIAIGVGPSAAFRCTDDMLAGAASLAQTCGLAIHVHAAESQAEVADERRAFGTTSFARMHRLGLLGPRTACAHCIWIEPEDIDILAATGAIAVHNPVSNLRLCAGIADVPKLVNAGVAVAIGTDGAASNDGVDVWEAVKLAALLPRRCGAKSVLDSATLLDMATRSGSRALGGHDAPLTIGALADFCIYPAAESPFASDDNFAAALVLSGPRRPSCVVIGGEIVLADGRFVAIDESEALANARKLALELAA
jgi:5-methylthioadenosine/S-adenosylhomocysteine deaminase